MAQEGKGDLETYILAMLPRIGEAKHVPYRNVTTDDGWVPSPQWCHSNAEHYVSVTPGAKRVRGWIITDRRQTGPILGLDPVMELTAHSVVEGADGEMFDITLTNLSNLLGYPFLLHEGSAETFDALIQKYQLGCIRLIPDPRDITRFTRMERSSPVPTED